MADVTGKWNCDSGSTSVFLFEFLNFKIMCDEKMDLEF
jgi:hypothetical protein